MTDIFLCDAPATGEPRRSSIYLPFISQEIRANQVAVFYQLLFDDPRQQRPILGTSALLEQAAEWKAGDVVAHDYWSHQASTGEWPNTTARRFGCQLPPEYGDGWNGVESLVAGSPDASVVFNALANSPRHRAHLFGENEFFRQQTHMGIDVATGGPWGWVWAIYIAPCQHFRG